MLVLMLAVMLPAAALIVASVSISGPYSAKKR